VAADSPAGLHGGRTLGLVSYWPATHLLPSPVNGSGEVPNHSGNE
jgi:hypothetical protein